MNATAHFQGMVGTLVGIGMVLAPLAVVVGLLRRADRVAQRREVRCARQIALTDAIHRELGVVVAPTVRRRRGGGWLVSITVPLDRPATVARILHITERLFGADHRSGRAPYEIVLTQRAIEPGFETGGGPPSTVGTAVRIAA